jgi:hypothetical protein
LDKDDSTWSVWRTDDNGNDFPVRNGMTKDAAIALRDELQTLGHKQLYWVRQTSYLDPDVRLHG